MMTSLLLLLLLLSLLLWSPVRGKFLVGPYKTRTIEEVDGRTYVVDDAQSRVESKEVSNGGLFSGITNAIDYITRPLSNYLFTRMETSVGPDSENSRNSDRESGRKSKRKTVIAPFNPGGHFRFNFVFGVPVTIGWYDSITAVNLGKDQERGLSTGGLLYEKAKSLLEGLLEKAAGGGDNDYVPGEATVRRLLEFIRTKRNFTLLISNEDSGTLPTIEVHNDDEVSDKYGGNSVSLRTLKSVVVEEEEEGRRKKRRRSQGEGVRNLRFPGARRVVKRRRKKPQEGGVHPTSAGDTEVSTQGQGKVAAPIIIDMEPTFPTEEELFELEDANETDSKNKSKKYYDVYDRPYNHYDPYGHRPDDDFKPYRPGDFDHDRPPPYDDRPYDEIPSIITQTITSSHMNIFTRLKMLDHYFQHLGLSDEDCKQKMLCEVAGHPEHFDPLSQVLLEQTKYDGSYQSLRDDLIRRTDGSRLLSYIEAVYRGQERGRCSTFDYRCPRRTEDMINFNALPVWKEMTKWLTIKVLARSKLAKN